MTRPPNPFSRDMEIEERAAARREGYLEGIQVGLDETAHLQGRIRALRQALSEIAEPGASHDCLYPSEALQALRDDDRAAGKEGQG